MGKNFFYFMSKKSELEKKNKLFGHLNSFMTFLLLLSPLLIQ